MQSMVGVLSTPRILNLWMATKVIEFTKNSETVEQRVKQAECARKSIPAVDLFRYIR